MKKSTPLVILLVIALVLICIMGYYIYILSTENQNNIAEITSLNNQISDLKTSINEYEEKLDAISNTLNSSNTDNNKLALGNYTVNEVSVNSLDGHSNEECGITLEDNNEFNIYMGWGTHLLGTYTINSNNLICNATSRTWEDGNPGSSSTDVTLTFSIVDNNILKLENIDINDTTTENLIYEDGLTQGMTYSIK